MKNAAEIYAEMQQAIVAGLEKARYDIEDGHVTRDQVIEVAATDYAVALVEQIKMIDLRKAEAAGLTTAIDSLTAKAGFYQAHLEDSTSPDEDAAIIVTLTNSARLLETERNGLLLTAANAGVNL